jgi:ATP-dependent DNA helicase PIF1
MEPPDRAEMQLLETLTLKQRTVVDKVLARENVFMTGGAGVGKSHVLKCVVAIARRRGMKVVVTASTGVAADQIDGVTLHSQLGLGLAQEPLPVLLKKVARSGKIKKKWAGVQLLVIDEVSMVDPDFFETVDQVLRALFRKPLLPFGGVALLITGDFFQLPPVLPRDRPVHLPSFAFQTRAWRDAIPTESVVQLIEIFRQAGDPQLAHVLSRLRRAEHTLDDIVLLCGRVGAVLELPDGIEPTRMYSRKVCVDAINHRKLGELPAESDSHVFPSSCFFDLDTEGPSKKRPRASSSGAPASTSVMTRVQKVAALKEAQVHVRKHAPTAEELHLKVGAQVMLLANLDVESGLVNGSRGVVTGFARHGGADPQPTVKFASRELTMERYVWEHAVPGAGTVSFRQIPLRLAWAVTIHKAQGLSLDYIDIKLDRSVFEYGQAYVALSRVRSLEGLTLEAFVKSVLRAHPEVIEFYRALDATEAYVLPTGGAAAATPATACETVEAPGVEVTVEVASADSVVEKVEVEIDEDTLEIGIGSDAEEWVEPEARDVLVKVEERRKHRAESKFVPAVDTFL